MNSSRTGNTNYAQTFLQCRMIQNITQYMCGGSIALISKSGKDIASNTKYELYFKLKNDTNQILNQ